MAETVKRTIEVEMKVDRTPIFFDIYTPIDESLLKRVIVESKGARAKHTYEFETLKAYVKVAHNYVLNSSVGIYYEGEMVLESNYSPRLLHSDVDVLVVGIDQGTGKDMYLIENGVPRLLFHVFYLSEANSKEGELEVMWTSPQGVADVINKEEFLELALSGVNDKKRYEDITHERG